MNFRYSITLTLAIAGILVLIGLYMVERQRAVTPSGGSGSWNSEIGYIEPTPNTPEGDGQTVLPEIPANTGPETLSIPVVTSTPPKKTTPKSDGTFDFNALLAQLSHERSTSVSPQTNSTYEQLLDAFSFTPTITVPAAKARTPAQEALFAYGNQIGARLQGFAAVNPNMTQTLSDQLKHRNDRALGDAVRDLGGRYKALGEGILSIRDVPPSVESAHQALGQSYVRLGEALGNVPDATDDQTFLAAITAYNNKADAFTNAFVGMVTLFSAENVTFESSDPGSVFSFRHN